MSNVGFGMSNERRSIAHRPWRRARHLFRGKSAWPCMAALLAVALPRVALGAERADYARLLEEKNGVLVTVKFVLKVKMPDLMGGGNDQEQDSEATCVMVDPKGLVLCSNTRLGGFTSIMKRMMGPMGEGISATPTDIKVLVGDDVDEREAELLARDSELDFAWIKIKDPGDTPFQCVDFSKGTTPAVGQSVVAVRRLGKYFGRTPVLAEGRITGMATKPRKLYIPSIDIATAQGLPVYTDDGKLLGMTVVQLPDSDDVTMNPMAWMSRAMDMQDMLSGLILPAAEVARATSRAMESAAGD